MIEKEQWPTNNSLHLIPWRYVSGATDKAILIPSCEAQTASDLNVTLENIWDSFAQVQLTKLSQLANVTNSLTEYVKGDG